MACGEAEIHVGDVGTAFRATISDENCNIVDLSDYEEYQLIFGKPDKSVIAKTATLYTDGTDGIIQYLSTADFLDQPGLWQVQGHVTKTGGQWKSNIVEFRVHKNLE